MQGIILAAGLSSRFSKHKMQIDLCGKTLIERTIESMFAVCDEIFVVCGYKIEEISEILKKYKKVKIVLNKKYEEGMFTSVKTGIEHITSERFFLLPGDIPLVQNSTYNALLKSYADIAIPSFQGIKGHPVLINNKLIKEIQDEPDASNLKNFINSKGFEKIEVDDEFILTDVDTIEDYKKLINRINMN